MPIPYMWPECRRRLLVTEKGPAGASKGDWELALS